MTPKDELERQWNAAAAEYAKERDKLHIQQNLVSTLRARMAEAKNKYLIFMEKQNGTYEAPEND